MRHRFPSVCDRDTLRVSPVSTALHHHSKALGNFNKQRLINLTLLYKCILVTAVCSQTLYSPNDSNYITSRNNNNKNDDDNNSHSNNDHAGDVNCNHHEASGESQHNNYAHQTLAHGSHQMQFSQWRSMAPLREQTKSDSSHQRVAAAHTLGRPTSPRPCDNCLAIPLVAIVGNKQVNGFIIPQLSKRSSSLNNPVEAPRSLRAREAYGYGGAKRGIPSYANSVPQCATMMPRYETPSKPNARPLEPRSDENCPMTGPLTVCDQIGSYPADVILHKFEAAKKSLMHSCFNIDSLFSDERDHLSEPFEKPWTHTGSHPTTHKASNRGSNETHANGDKASNNTSLRLDVDQASGANALADYSIPQVVNEKPMRPYERGYSASQSRDQADGTMQSWGPTAQTAAASKGSDGKEDRRISSTAGADDFVKLVEQRALSLGFRETDNVSGGRYEVVTNRFQGATSSVARPTNGSSLADRLLSLSGSLDQYRGGRGRSSSVRLNGGTPRTQLEPRQYGTSPTLKNLNTSSKLLANLKHPRNLPLTRRRRQTSTAAAAIAVPAGGEQSSGEGDPESVADSADGLESQLEPLCRVKSIYISPKAALNDKKQWKYVVNAPERNPQIRQIIRVDICEDPFGPCSEQVALPFGFTSQCKQKYSKKKLLALDSGTGFLEVDTFFIPSCCVCQLIRERQPAEEVSTPIPDDASEDPSSDDTVSNGSAS